MSKVTRLDYCQFLLSSQINYTLTYFAAEGDYRLTRKITAKRVGDCPAEGVAKTTS